MVHTAAVAADCTSQVFVELCLVSKLAAAVAAAVGAAAVACDIAAVGADTAFAAGACMVEFVGVHQLLRPKLAAVTCVLLGVLEVA